MTQIRAPGAPHARGGTREWGREDRGAPRTPPDGPKYRPVFKKEPHIDDFMTLFLSGLVLKGHRHIGRRSEAGATERRRMHMLSEHINTLYDREKENPDLVRLHFLLRLRTYLSPGLIGAYDELYTQLLRKTSTIVSITECGYRVDLQPVTAQSHLDNADPALRELAEGAVAAYMAPIEQ